MFLLMRRRKGNVKLIALAIGVGITKTPSNHKKSSKALIYEFYLQHIRKVLRHALISHTQLTQQDSLIYINQKGDYLHKLQMKQDNQTKQIIGFDIGNSFIRIYFSNKTLTLYNSLLLQKGSVYINKKPTKNCLMDIPLLLSMKFQDVTFASLQKYYNYSFKKGFNKNIIMKLPHQTCAGQFYGQLSLLLILKGIFMTNAHLKYLLAEKQIKLLATVFEGEINSYRISLSQCLKVSGIKHFNFINTNNCIAVSYLKDNRKKRDESQVIGIIDFGDRGLTFSICKVYSQQIGIVEVLSCDVSLIGGNLLTNLLADYVAERLTKEKGMDVSKSPQMMHRLKILCSQAKHTLTSSQMAFVRLDGLPDILVYGCQVSSAQFQKCIIYSVKQNIRLIKNVLNSKPYELSKLILNGSSCKIPLFGNLLQQQLGEMKIIKCNEDWIKHGIHQIKSEGIHILDITSFELRIQGDQKFTNTVISKGQSIPLRKKVIMKFPSGELTYSMKFYQNNLLIATCFIPERPSESKYNLYVEVNHNKMIKIYATNTRGLIKMNCNMMEINRDEYIKYEPLLSQIDFHNQND